MHILDEWRLADIELRKTFLQRLIAFLAVAAFVILAEYFCFWYVSRSITSAGQPENFYNYAHHEGYYQLQDDDTYILYVHDGTKWVRFVAVSETTFNTVRSQYANYDNLKLFHNGTPDSSDLGIITWVHKLVFTIIFGLGLGFVLEPALRRGQNKRQVLIFCQVYDIESNNELFDDYTLETIEVYKKICHKKPLTADDRMAKFFLIERLLTPEKAEARQRTYAKHSALRKRKSEEQALKAERQLQAERLEREKKEKAQKEKNAEHARKVREKTRRDNIRKEYDAAIAHIDEVLLATEEPIPQITPDMTEEEKAQVKELQREEAIRVKEKRQLIKHMRKQSSFMK